VIHPCAKILAETGPIVIGENNLIEENATIINKYVVPGFLWIQVHEIRNNLIAWQTPVSVRV